MFLTLHHQRISPYTFGMMLRKRSMTAFCFRYFLSTSSFVESYPL